MPLLSKTPNTEHQTQIHRRETLDLLLLCTTLTSTSYSGGEGGQGESEKSNVSFLDHIFEKILKGMWQKRNKARHFLKIQNKRSKIRDDKI
jgi:hypothetical protein